MHKLASAIWKVTYLSFESLSREVSSRKFIFPAFPRPLRDHDINLPMFGVEFCMLNVCSLVVWPFRVAEWWCKFANILLTFEQYNMRQILCLPNRIGVIFSCSFCACLSNLPTLAWFFDFLRFFANSAFVQLSW